MLAYGFVGHLLVVNEVDDANRTQDSTGECCLRFGRHVGTEISDCARVTQ